ncbi:glycosyltransferase [Bdellovibrionota bacterium FG-2]
MPLPHTTVHGRVLLLTPSFETEGLLTELRARGQWEPFVLPSPPALWGLLKFIHAHKINIIHSHGKGTLFYAVLTKILTFGRIRIVHSQPNFAPLSFLVRFVDVLAVASESLQAPYEALGVAQPKLRVINNGVVFPKQPVVTFDEKIQLRREILAQLSSGDKIIPPRAPFPVFATKDHWILDLAPLHTLEDQKKAAELWSGLNPVIRKASLLWIFKAEPSSDLLKAFESVPNRDRVVFIRKHNEGALTRQLWLRASDLALTMEPHEALGSGLAAVVSSDVRQNAAAIEAALTAPGYRTPLYYYHLWRANRGVRQDFSLMGMVEKYGKAYEDSLATSQQASNN